MNVLMTEAVVLEKWWMPVTGKFGFGRCIGRIVFVCLLFLLWQCATMHKCESKQDKFWVRFVYQDSSAKKVCVAGSFNNWSPNRDCLKRNGDSWTLEISLPPGRYSYVFVINGQRMVRDPQALLFEQSGFGTMNSVLIVE